MSIILWAYRKNYKRLNKATRFQLFFGIEVILTMELMLPSLRITRVRGIGLENFRRIDEKDNKDG